MTSYTPSQLLAPRADHELPRSISSLYTVSGMDVGKRQNLVQIDEKTLIYSAGNTLVTFNMETKKRKFLLGLDGGAIGAFTFSPDRSVIAVACNGMKPCIYIYSFPSMIVTKVLKLGTERGYSSLDFSPDGTLLSSVGQNPDFLLTVWDWKEERITLHTKAFGQDVYKVAFSKEENAGRLTTSGTGHIRFWNMAKTFTGLKLQGEIGKFGKIDLSDIEAFVELPDSKVVSGSESGHLLLWEGNFVKCRLVTSKESPELMYKKAGEDLIFGDVPAHAGGVCSITHDRELDMIITAGVDGNIKFWSFAEIDVAEVDSDITMDYPIMPSKTIPLGAGVSIKHIVDSGDSYLVEDANGALFRQSKTATSPDDKETLWIFHSGPIVGVVTSSVEHYCATAGSDGQVFIWDYITKTVVASNKSNHGCTSITAPPTTLDETGRTYTVGFEDGVMRCFTFSDDALTLKQVIKPHNGPITAISYSPDGKYVATGGHDGICFVIKCPDPIDSAGAYTPIGFVTSEDEAPITALSWKEDSKALMYSYANTMVEMDVSDGISAISANSFEMEPKTTVYHYKDRPVIKDASEEDGLEEKKGDEQSEDHVEITPPPICHACYKVGEDKDNFLVGLGAEKAGKIFEGKFGDEYSLGEYHSGVAIHNVEIDDVAKVTKISYSSSKKFIIITCDDGSVTVRPNSELGFFTKYSIHDSSSGGSSGAAISFDDEFLLTTGFDGLLVTHRLNPEGVTEAAVKAKAGEKINETLPDSIFNFEDSGEGSSVPPEGFKEVFSSSKEGQEKAANAAAAAAVEDITDDAAYSIQDEKLRKEEDARKLAAEKKKDGVREVIANMQKEYSDLVKKNSNLPIELQLTEEELRVDPEYDQILAEQGRQMIEEVQLECAHESEKSSIRLGKLQKEYIEVLECEPFCVHGMKNGLAVPSFPTRKLSPELQDLLDIVHSVMEGEGGGSTRGKMYSEGSGRSRRSHRASRVTKQRINITDLGLDEDGNEKKLTRPERRKMMRLERQHALDELIEKKPSDDADDPRDVKAIEFAKKNLGDYKIKTSEGYEVPEEQQVNADKKMRQLVLLIESIHNIKVKFNKRLTATRDAKCDTYQSVKAFNERIKNIDKQLGQPELSDKLWLPELMSSEYPEDRSFFTQTDVDAFLKSAEGADGDVSKAVCPMTALPSKTLQVMEKDTKANAELWDKEALKLARSLPILCATFDSETFGEMPVYEEGATLSQMEEDELSEISKKLTFQRATLVDKIEADVKAVDDQISMLRKDRLVFAGELKAAELRMILLSKELKLLQDFEAKDKMLTSKLEKCQRDKAEVVASISDCHGRLETKSGDLEEWVAKEHEIMEEFKKIVPESNGFYEQLLKIFKRKIKRKKVKNNDDDDDEMDSEEESDDDYDSDSDDDDDEEEVDDSCPPGCDISLYETIIALREKRLDQEETLNEFQKELDELKKAHDRHIGRERQIDKDLKSTEVEILRFQTEKQKELNELLVTVPLKIGQIKLWKKETDSEGNDIEVPENPKILRESIKIDEGAIFSETTLEKLKSRIGELKDEIVVDKSNFGGLHKEKKALEKDKLSREKEISKKEKECEEIQMLKFGQIIDIGELDKISVNNDEAELKNKSKTLEVSNEKEVFSMHAKHRKLKEKLMNLTNINTDKLNGIAGLNARQFFLEKELNGKGGGMQVADDGPTVRQETEERNRLVALVKLQAKEVDALKAEINLLRRKGGHIYAPPPPPELIGGDDVMAMDAPEGSIEGEVKEDI